MFGSCISGNDSPPGTRAVCRGGAGIGARVKVLDLDAFEVFGFPLAVIEPAEETELFSWGTTGG